MAPVDNDDSGMESQEGSMGGSTKEEEESPPEPPKPPQQPQPEIESSYDDEPDETLTERLWGLTEMFPDTVRHTTQVLADKTTTGVKSLYSLSRNVAWVVFTTSIILFAPVIFEVERAQMEEMQRTQQKQMLLGPSTAVTGGGGLPPLLQQQSHR